MSKVIKPKAFSIEEAGKTTAIHAKLSTDLKKEIDLMSQKMNVPQWVIINSLCKKGLDSLGK